MDGDAFSKVTLGAREYELQPQRIGRISRKLGAIRRLFRETPQEVTSSAYEALRVFIPDIDPEWRLAGYPSAEAYAEVQRHAKAIADAQEAAIAEARDAFAGTLGSASWADLDDDARAEFPGIAFDEETVEPDWVDPYDEGADRSPSFPEIADTIEAIFQVNGGKRLERLLANLGIDSKMMSAILRNEYIRWASSRSPSAPRPTGASTSTTSGTTPPTSDELETTPAPDLDLSEDLPASA